MAPWLLVPWSLLVEDFKPVFDKFHSLLDSAIYIFDNKFLSENTLLGKTMEVETEDEDEE